MSRTLTQGAPRKAVTSFEHHSEVLPFLWVSIPMVPRFQSSGMKMEQLVYFTVTLV